MAQQYIHSAGIIVYRATPTEPLYLILQHTYGGHWDFPKGKIEEGETLAQAARRELAEETGIAQVTLSDDVVDVINYTYRHRGDIVYKKVSYFTGQTQQADVTLSREHTAYQWCTYADAMQKLTFVNAQEVLKKVHAA